VKFERTEELERLVAVDSLARSAWSTACAQYNSTVAACRVVNANLALELVRQSTWTTSPARPNQFFTDSAEWGDFGLFTESGVVMTLSPGIFLLREGSLHIRLVIEPEAYGRAEEVGLGFLLGPSSGV